MVIETKRIELLKSYQYKNVINKINRTVAVTTYYKRLCHIRNRKRIKCANADTIKCEVLFQGQRHKYWRLRLFCCTVYICQHWLHFSQKSLEPPSSGFKEIFWIYNFQSFNTFQW